VSQGNDDSLAQRYVPTAEDVATLLQVLSALGTPLDESNVRRLLIEENGIKSRVVARAEASTSSAAAPVATLAPPTPPPPLPTSYSPIAPRSPRASVDGQPGRGNGGGGSRGAGSSRSTSAHSEASTDPGPTRMHLPGALLLPAGSKLRTVQQTLLDVAPALVPAPLPAIPPVVSPAPPPAPAPTPAPAARRLPNFQAAVAADRPRPAERANASAQHSVSGAVDRGGIIDHKTWSDQLVGGPHKRKAGRAKNDKFGQPMEWNTHDGTWCSYWLESNTRPPAHAAAPTAASSSSIAAAAPTVTPAPALDPAVASNPAPAAAAADVGSEDFTTLYPWAQQVQQLVDMGFLDIESNELALAAADGDLNDAISTLRCLS